MRHQFGGSPSDYAMERVGNQLLVRPAAVGTVWSALTGGVQYTDLTDLAGAPITTVTADADGAVAFFGPDGITNCFIDFGYGRRYTLAATDTGAILATFMGQGGAPDGWATLDGSGLVPPEQLPKQLDWLIVTDPTYGAKGDGVHDDTTAIQTAINACPQGGIVYLPRGIYKTTATLDLKSGVTLLGSHSNLMVGPGMTTADYPCYIQPAIPFTGTSVLKIIGEADGTHPDISGEQRITNLMFDGSQLTGTSIDGLFAKGNVQNVVLENVCIRQMPNNGIITASRTDGLFPYSWRLHHVMVDNCHSNGIVFEQNTDLTLDDVQVIGSWAQGIVLTNCANTQLQACRTEWNGSHGYHFTGNWGNWPGSGGLQMTNCSTDRNGQYGVLIDATGNGPMVLTGLMLRRDGRNGGPGGGGYAGLGLTNQLPVVVNGVTCYPGTDDTGTANTSPQYGVKIFSARDVQINDAYLHANTLGLFDNGTSTRVTYGSNVTTVRGNNFSEARIVRPRSGGERGIYVPAGWGATWRTKLGAAGTGKAILAAVGGSSTQGYYASNLRTAGWVDLLRTSLQGVYGDGGSGYKGSGLTGLVQNADGVPAAAVTAYNANGSNATLAGAWSVGGSSFGPGAKYVFTSTVGDSYTVSVRGTQVDIYIVAGSSAPHTTFSYQIDGGAVVTVPTTGTADNIQKTTITGLVAGNHTVVVKHAGTAGQYVSVCGIAGSNTTGVIVNNFARYGSRSTNFAATDETTNTAWNGSYSYPADLVILTHAPNDAAANDSGEVWVKNQRIIMDRIRNSGGAVGATDLMIVLPHIGTFDTATVVYQDYAARVRGLAEAYGAAVVNMWAVGRNSWNYWNSLGYWSNSANPGVAGTDNVHPSDAGHQAIADTVLPLLMG